jgi:glyceraldehyde-3-phosphate dehydrogenase/erythrose-4-phosphate dehydrogenase
VIDVVAINDITDTATLANLLQYDSTYGPLRERVHHTDDSIVVGGTMIRVTAQRDPAALDRRAVGVDIVIESTGRFSTREAAAAHLTGGARKVILSSPGKGIDATPRARGERRDLQPGRAPDHLERILYDELRRVAPARTVGRCPSEAVAKCAGRQ